MNMASVGAGTKRGAAWFRPIRCRFFSVAGPRALRRIGQCLLWSMVVVVVAGSTPAASFGEQSGRTARGMITAVHRTVLSSQIEAKIRRIPFKEGEAFRKGQELVGFDCRLMQSQRDKTQAQLKAARLKLENSRKLEQLQSIGALEVALAEAEVDKRKAEKAIADITVSRCSIRAPFDGRVVTQHAQAFASVGPQQKLLEIVSTAKLEVEVMVPSDWLAWLETGMVFAVEMDATQETVQGEVKAIGAVVDPVSKMLQVRGRLTSVPDKLLPGMSATVRFNR